MNTIEKTEFRPYLIQRVEKALDYPAADAGNLVEFYKAKYELPRRSKEIVELQKKYPVAIKALLEVLPLDLMGRAEYEWGEVPNCLMEMCMQRASMTAFTTAVTGQPYVYVQVPATMTSIAKAHRNTVAISGWCLPDQEDDVLEFLHDQAEHGSTRYDLCEPSEVQGGCFGYVHRKLDAKTWTKDDFEWVPGRVTGWLDLTNYWFASKDPLQTRGMAELLGIDLTR